MTDPTDIPAILEGPIGRDAEATWKAEIERCMVEIEAGTATLGPWEDVKRRIEREFLGR